MVTQENHDQGEVDGEDVSDLFREILVQILEYLQHTSVPAFRGVCQYGVDLRRPK